MCSSSSSTARMIGVCHQSTARAIREQTSPNAFSCRTLTSYDRHALLSRVTIIAASAVFHIAILSQMQLIVQPYSRLTFENTSAIKFYRRWHQHLTSTALTLIAHLHLEDVYLMSAFPYASLILWVFAHLQYISKMFPVRCQIYIE